MSLTLKDFIDAEQKGINRTMLKQRINRGWDREKALSYPKGVRQSMELEYLLTPEQYRIAEKNGISKRNLEQRVYTYAWDVEEAMTIPTDGRGYKRDTKYGEYIKLAETNGVSYKAFHNRVHTLGWTMERAAKTPIRKVKENDH
ncbi:hypothetical protein MPH47_06175 [Psychrobacillus psychrodurans]|uniref:hypothetical protein n=1 Tax=Psychrobacillus psychrodurans TaxID=126157 RepID=UPI001F4DA47C|nr:hypothetical protein [Psychrobacillus psychrodurans]MCK1996817.1 hypothetical protein [Psychrobacillus psychrodurans]